FSTATATACSSTKGSDETHPLHSPRIADRRLDRSRADPAAHSDRQESRAEEAGKGGAGAASRVAGAAETGFSEEGRASARERSAVTESDYRGRQSVRGRRRVLLLRKIGRAHV